MKRFILPVLVAVLASIVLFLLMLPSQAVAAPMGLDDTPTETPTPTTTATPTATATYTGGIIWADSSLSLSVAIKDAIASVLSATPPEGHDGNIYAILDATAPGDGHWLISIANLSGIEAPYTGWDIMVDGVWMGSVDCTGTEPTWSCDYYIPPISHLHMADEGLLLFPWQSGTSAIYGVAGVHETDCGGCLLPGSSAVDFFGADSYGTNFMPPQAYAPAGGTIIATCPGVYNMGIRVHGDTEDYVIFHLIPNPELTIGTYFQRGALIGPLAYGNFTEANGCGHATQASDQYHIHFTFIPTDGYLVIGGCTLDIATQAFICGSDTIHPLGTLHNGGSNPPPCVGADCPPSGLGGEHLWNGIITALLSFFQTSAHNILTTHTSWGLYEEVDRIWTVLLDFAWLIAASNLIWIVPSVICYGIIVSIEIVRWAYVIWRYIVGLEPIA